MAFLEEQKKDGKAPLEKDMPKPPPLKVTHIPKGGLDQLPYMVN